MKKIYRHSIRICIALLLPFATFTPSDAQQIEIGTGTTVSVFSPICRSRDYSVYEIIYLNTELNISGNITNFAFHRSDGTDVDPIQNVSLFIKHTSNTSLSAGTYSETGFQLVYQGNWPNDAGDGWREVVLSTPFAYDGVSNLQVLVMKGYQPAAANTPVTPRWYYSNNSTSSTRARRYVDNTAVDSTTALITVGFNANVRLTFGSVGVREVGENPVSIFPNPASDHLSININAHSKSNELTFELFDLSGRLLLRQSIDKSVMIPIAQLPSGLYFYSIRSCDKVWSEKLIVQ